MQLYGYFIDVKHAYVNGKACKSDLFTKRVRGAALLEKVTNIKVDHEFRFTLLLFIHFSLCSNFVFAIVKGEYFQIDG